MRLAALIAIIGLLITQLVAVTVIPALASGALDVGEDVSELGTFDFASRAFQLNALNPLGGGGGGTGTLTIAMVAIVLFGVFVATTDYRFGGIVTTVLAQPRRLRVLGGKVVATFAAAAALGVAFALICLGVLLLATSVLSDAGLVLSWGEVAGTALRAAAVTALMALLGLAIGIICRSQLAGTLVAISVLVAEPVVQTFAGLLSGVVPLWAQLLPLSLGQAVLTSAEQAQAVSPTIALLVLTAIVAALLGISGLLLRRRDL